MRPSEFKPSSMLGYALNQEALRNSLLISLAVGCALCLINQWEALAAGPYTPRLALKIPLNFLIPFAVSLTGAGLNRCKKRGHAALDSILRYRVYNLPSAKPPKRSRRCGGR